MLYQLTDEQAKELATYPNQSEVIRNAFEVYHGHITPEVLKGLRLAYEKINQRLAGIEQALDVIASVAQVTINKTDDWGAWWPTKKY